jgi:hypothetical protein
MMLMRMMSHRIMVSNITINRRIELRSSNLVNSSSLPTTETTTTAEIILLKGGVASETSSEIVQAAVVVVEEEVVVVEDAAATAVKIKTREETGGKWPSRNLDLAMQVR